MFCVIICVKENVYDQQKWNTDEFEYTFWTHSDIHSK